MLLRICWSSRACTGQGRMHDGPRVAAEPAESSVDRLRDVQVAHLVADRFPRDRGSTLTEATAVGDADEIRVRPGHVAVIPVLEVHLAAAEVVAQIDANGLIRQSVQREVRDGLAEASVGL